MKDDELAAIRRRFDERAQDYDSSTMHRALAGAVAGFAAPNTRSEVLDVGTGTGLVLRAMAERCPGVTMSGIDLSPRMIDVACRELPGAAFRVGDAASLPYDADAFDLVTCVTALHLMLDAQKVAVECARVLRPAGRLVTATFTASDSVEHGGANPARQRFDTVDKLSSVLGPVGLGLSRTTIFSRGKDAVLIAEWLVGRGDRPDDLGFDSAGAEAGVEGQP